MKKIILNSATKVLLMVVMLSSVAGCSKFLEETPYDFIAIEELEDCQTSVDYLVTGVYSKWSNDMFRYNNLPKYLEIDSDYVSGPDWIMKSVGAGSYQGESEFDNVWKYLYHLIERANTALAYIDPMVNPSDDAKRNAIGEIKFLKAHAYFLLVRAFGAVPIRELSTTTSGASSDVIYTPRSPISEVYDEIISLLEYAEQNCYNISDSGYSAGHIAAGSAAGLLAKVYATMASGSISGGTVTVYTGDPYDRALTTSDLIAGKDEALTKNQVAGYEGFDATECYTKVISYCEKLENGDYGSYDLLAFEDMWQHSSFDKTSGAEYMFTIYALSGDEFYGNQVSRYYTYTEDSAGQLTKGLYIGYRNHWYDLFEDDDKRITEGVIHYWKDDGSSTGRFYPSDYNTALLPANGITYSKATGSNNLSFTKKYYNVSDRTIERTDAYYPMLRYADVLLLYAEALNETNTNQTKAKELVKRIRERSLATALTVDLDNATTIDDLRSIIIEERAKELAFESDRRWDLIRWGIYVEAMNAIGGADEANILKTRSDKHLLYPIPVSEILANKYITENNPGWN